MRTGGRGGECNIQSSPQPEVPLIRPPLHRQASERFLSPRVETKGVVRPVPTTSPARVQQAAAAIGANMAMDAQQAFCSKCQVGTNEIGALSSAVKFDALGRSNRLREALWKAAHLNVMERYNDRGLGSVISSLVAGASPSELLDICAALSLLLLAAAITGAITIAAGYCATVVAIAMGWSAMTAVAATMTLPIPTSDDKPAASNPHFTQEMAAKWISEAIWISEVISEDAAAADRSDEKANIVSSGSHHSSLLSAHPSPSRSLHTLGSDDNKKQGELPQPAVAAATAAATAAAAAAVEPIKRRSMATAQASGHLVCIVTMTFILPVILVSFGTC